MPKAKFRPHIAVPKAAAGITNEVRQGGLVGTRVVPQLQRNVKSLAYAHTETAKSLRETVIWVSLMRQREAMTGTTAGVGSPPHRKIQLEPQPDKPLLGKEETDVAVSPLYWSATAKPVIVSSLQ